LFLLQLPLSSRHASHPQAVVAAQNGIRLLLHEFALTPFADPATLLFDAQVLNNVYGGLEGGSGGDIGASREDSEGSGGGGNQDSDSTDMNEPQSPVDGSSSSSSSTIQMPSMDRWTVRFASHFECFMFPHFSLLIWMS
jgi:hypothetical protein